MTTRDTLEAVEDFLPTRADYGLNSSSTSHQSTRQNEFKIWTTSDLCSPTLDSPSFERLHEGHETRVQENNQVTEARKENSPDVDRKTGRLRDLCNLRDQRCSGERALGMNDLLTQHRVGQRQSSKVRSRL